MVLTHLAKIASLPISLVLPKEFAQNCLTQWRTYGRSCVQSLVCFPNFCGELWPRYDGEQVISNSARTAKITGKHARCEKQSTRRQAEHIRACRMLLPCGWWVLAGAGAGYDHKQHPGRARSRPSAAPALSFLAALLCMPGPVSPRSKRASRGKTIPRQGGADTAFRITAPQGEIQGPDPANNGY